MGRIGCWLTSRRLQEYLDGELSDRRRQAVQAHLATCDACRHLLVEYRAQADAAGAIRLLTPPEGFTQRVMLRLEAAEASHPVRGSVRPFSLAHAGWVAAAFAVLALALGVWNGLPGRERPPANVGPTQSQVAVAPTEPVEPVAPVATEDEPAQAPGAAARPVEPPKPAAPGTRTAGTEYASDRPVRTGTRSRARRVEVARTVEPTNAATSSDAKSTQTLLAEAIASESEGRLDDALAAYEMVANDTSDPQVAVQGAMGKGRVYERMGMTVTALLAYDDALSTSGVAPIPGGSDVNGTY